MTSAFHKASGLALVTVKKEEKKRRKKKKKKMKKMKKKDFFSSSWFFFVALSHGQPHTAFGGLISMSGRWLLLCMAELKIVLG